MSIPVVEPLSNADLLVAARRYLVDSGVPTRLISEGLLGSDDLYPEGWIFQDTADGSPFRDPENTGTCAIVLDSVDTWAAQNNHNTSTFPRLRITIFADPTRDPAGSPLKYDARVKARKVWEAVNPLFHDAANRVHAFDSLPIVSTLQGGGFSVQDVPNGDGQVRATCGYDLILY